MWMWRDAQSSIYYLPTCGLPVTHAVLKRVTVASFVASAPRRCGFCCSVLQYVAVCCSVLQCVAVCCSVLQCVAVCCSVSCL